MRPTSSRLKVWREPRRQAASARRSDLVCSAKARNMIGGRIGHVGERRRFERVRDRVRQPHPLDETDAEAAENGGAHPVGMRQREESRDPRAHRVAHDVGARQTEMVDQRAHVVGHDARCDRRPGRRACWRRRGRDCRAQ